MNRSTVFIVIILHNYSHTALDIMKLVDKLSLKSWYLSMIPYGIKSQKVITFIFTATRT
jgi:hypothetical protein